MKNGIIDEIDRSILMILQNNGRETNAEVARKVGMAPSAVLERVRKLEQEGVIQGYEARINPKTLDRALTAFIQVLAEEVPGSFNAGQRLAQVPEVQEVHYTAGRDSYLVKVRVKDTEALQRTLASFGTIPGLRDTRTTVVLTTVKETSRIFIEEAAHER